MIILLYKIYMFILKYFENINEQIKRTERKKIKLEHPKVSFLNQSIDQISVQAFNDSKYILMIFLTDFFFFVRNMMLEILKNFWLPHKY